MTDWDGIRHEVGVLKRILREPFFYRQAWPWFALRCLLFLVSWALILRSVFTHFSMLMSVVQSCPEITLAVTLLMMRAWVNVMTVSSIPPEAVSTEHGGKAGL